MCRPEMSGEIEGIWALACEGAEVGIITNGCLMIVAKDEASLSSGRSEVGPGLRR